jgi:hypothetical protein
MLLPGTNLPYKGIEPCRQKPQGNQRLLVAWVDLSDDFVNTGRHWDAPLRRTLIRTEQFRSINITVPDFAAALLVFGRMLHNYHVAVIAAYRRKRFINRLNLSTISDSKKQPRALHRRAVSTTRAFGASAAYRFCVPEPLLTYFPADDSVSPSSRTWRWRLGAMLDRVGVIYRSIL